MDENEKLISKSNLGIVLDAMKTKFDEVPDSLADLSQDSTHRTVTDAEKSEWNEKASVVVWPQDDWNVVSENPLEVQFSSRDLDTWDDSRRILTSAIVNLIDPTLIIADFLDVSVIFSDYEGERPWDMEVIRCAICKNNNEVYLILGEEGMGYTIQFRSIKIPETLSDLTEDSLHLLVTEAEKATWNAKQNALVSGQNIKTVNGQSILGSGDLSAGLVDDIKQNGTSIVSNKIANIVLETSLGLDSNNAATSTAVRAFVNSSINSLAAFYITSDTTGNAFATRAALTAGPWYYAGSTRTPTQNDYAIVTADETHDGMTARYLYTGAQWSFQYTFGVTFTQAQLDAMNSGITSALRQTYDAHLANANIHVTASDKSKWNSKTEPIPSWPTKSWSVVSQNPLTISIDEDDLLTWQDAKYDIYVFEVLESIDPSLLDIGFLGCNVALIDDSYLIKTSRHAIITNDGGTSIITGEEDDDGNIVFSLIRVPDELSDLSGDNLHRLVTDAEKATWNAKGTYSKPSGGIPASDLAEGVIPETDEVDELEIDTTPTAGSENLVTSGGVKTALDAKQATPAIITSGTAITLVDNTEYKLSGVTTLDISFPASGSYSCWMTITTDATTAPTITFPASALFVGAKPSFGVGETWKIFIEDGVIVSGKAVSAT